MNGLLKIATEAHGGLDRWNQLSLLTASVSVTGEQGRTLDNRDDPRTAFVGFDENKRKIPNPVLVAIDIQELAFQ